MLYGAILLFGAIVLCSVMVLYGAGLQCCMAPYSCIVPWCCMVRLLVPWSPVSQMPGNGVSSPVTDVDEDDYNFGSQDYFSLDLHWL